MHRAEHIGGEGLDRLFVRQPNQRLRREMEDHLRPDPIDHALDRRQVADIGDVVIDQIADPRRLEQAWIGRRRQRQTRDLGPELMQPERQPATLEAGMAGDEDTPSLPAGRPDRAAHQTFHGASSRLHRSSR